MKKFLRRALTALLLLIVTVSLDYYGVIVAPQVALASTTSITFDTPADYTYDTSKIEVTGGTASLERTPAWWDDTYQYRQKITVTANASNDITTSNTITLNKDIASLVSGGKMQADHDDLRIVYWNGSSNTEIDRDYLDTELSASPTLSTVRFKAQAAVNAGFSDDGYYLYYGNGSATSAPADPSNIYEYNEDFSSDPGWSTNNASCDATTSVSGGRLRKTGTTASTDCFRYDAAHTFDTAKNWYEEITIQRNSGFLASIAIRDFVGGTAGGWWFQSDDFNDVVKIWSSSGGLQNHSAFAQTNDVDYRYTMQFERLFDWEPTCASDTGWARLSGYINGTRYMQQADWQGNVCLDGWSPGVHTYNDATAQWDDVKVWEYINESLSAGSEQTRYANDGPTITPVSAISFDRLDGFSQTATLDGGDIGYILSNDGGTTWYYYNSGWTTADNSYGQVSDASTIDANVATFPVGSGSLMVRAFFLSDGTQHVQLDTLSITVNSDADAPTLSSPANSATNISVTPALVFSATDPDSDYLRYKIQLDTVNTFDSGGLQTFDQTASQTGWSGQNAQSSTAYTSGTSATYTVQTALSYGTTYYWRAAAIDPGGMDTFSAYSSTRSFTTLAATTISSVAVDPDAISAVITWTTNHSANSTVDYGLTASYGSTATNASNVTSHSITLTNLTANTVYHYRITSTGNTTTSTTDATFKTDDRIEPPTAVKVNGSAAKTGSVFNTIISATQFPKITGRAEPDATITLTFGDYMYSAATTSTGTWSVKVTEPLPKGGYVVYASVSQGNDFTPIEKIAQFTVTTGTYVPTPTILEPLSGQWYISDTPSIIGLAKSGNTVRIFIDGSFIGTTVTTTHASGTGHFIFRTPTLEKGVHTLAVEAIDGDGNFSRRSSPLQFKIGLPTIGPTILAIVHGSAIAHGVAWGDTDVTVYANGKAIGVFYVGGEGIQNFSYKLPITTDGVYAITMKAVDNQDKPSRLSNTAYYTHSRGTVVYQVPISNQGTYTVKAGDTLWKIAAEVYGDGAQLTKLVQANKAAHPEIATGAHVIRVGWVLIVP